MRASGPGILGLHEDALVHVFSHLCGIDNLKAHRCTPVLRGSSLERARDAFALAQTCTLLLSLFKRRFLVRIDSFQISHAEDCRNVSHFLRSRYQGTQHIRAMVRIAAENLQELRIPPCGRWENRESILREVLLRCPNLHTLAFPELRYPSDTLMYSLFSSATLRLRALTIQSPSVGTIEELALATSGYLRQIKLTNLVEVDMFSLVSFLRRRGKSLDSLTLHFEDFNQYSSGQNSWGLSRDAGFFALLATDLLEWCPILEFLDLGLPFLDFSDVQVAEEDVDIDYLNDNEVMSLAKAQLDRGVKPHGITSQLKYVRISTFQSRAAVQRLFGTLSTLIAPAARLELRFPNAIIVIPTPGSSFRRPFYRALNITSLNETAQSLELGNTDYGKIEEVCLSFHNRQELDTSLALTILRRIHTEAGSNFKTLRVQNFGRSYFDDFLRLIGVSEEVPSAVTLQIPRDFVCFWSTVFNPFMLGNIPVNLKRLIFTNGHMCIHESECHNIVAAIPNLLHTIKMRCPHIEGIYLQRARETCEPHSDNLRQLTRSSLNTLEVFESERPSVDVSTIKAQLLLWMEDCFW